MARLKRAYEILNKFDEEDLGVSIAPIVYLIC